MKKNKSFFLIGAVVVSFCLVCGVAVLALNTPTLMTTSTSRAEQYAQEYDGNVDAYNQIFNSSDCVFLQNQFDTAYDISIASPGTVHATRAIGFMKASDERMKEIGCY